MFAVQPPKQRQYKAHDLVSILIEETSKQSADQSLKTDKKYDSSVTLNSFIDLMALYELQLRQGNLSNEKLLDISADNKFDGKGTFARNDKFSMKIEAEIIDVKPNGLLVLEAKKVIDKDGETQTTILSGNCRPEDVTTNNTVLSTQLANLTLVSRNEGHVHDAGKKGLIPRVLDAVFSF
jgi:flagellar L-ring protein precursor FlgH